MLVTASSNARKRCAGRPCMTSHATMKPSLEAETSRRPSAVNCRPVTSPRWPTSRRTTAPEDWVPGVLFPHAWTVYLQCGEGWDHVELPARRTTLMCWHVELPTRQPQLLEVLESRRC